MIEELGTLNRVYHYTSVDALFAILEGYRNRKDKKQAFLPFWASNIFDENDKREMEDGYNYIKQFLPQFEIDNNIPEKQRLSEIYKDTNCEEMCRIDFLRLKKKETTECGIVPYVISLSKLHDFLPMWTLYGNMGKGVCLAFDFDKLINELLYYAGKFTIGSVAYDEDSAKTSVFEILSRSSYIFNSSRDKISNLADLCFFLSPFFKRKDYKYEQEVRIVTNKPYGFDEDGLTHITKDTLNHILNGTIEHKIEKHIEFPISASALSEVMIGPNADSKVLEHIISLEREDCGLQFNIKCSNISFEK